MNTEKRLKDFISTVIKFFHVNLFLFFQNTCISYIFELLLYFLRVTLQKFKNN